ncbi:MAG: family 16 glycosylhydrolase [Saprospiraceae bacterium]
MQVNIKSVLFLLLFIPFSCTKDNGDDPTPTVPEISILDSSAPENEQSGMLTFTVQLNQAATTNVIVNYSTLNGTAFFGSDYEKIENAQLIIPANASEATISVSILNDDNKENDEYFEVVLLNPINGTLVRDRAKGTIVNDDDVNQLQIPTTGFTSPLTYPGMTLVWQDEFDQGALNGANWTHEIGTGQGGWGNNELQYYRPENTYFDSDFLIIEAREENVGGSNYTSSRMVTKDKFEFQYGRVDIRAALPQGQGLWPALWMLGANIDDLGWPACGEIDIMEMIGSQPGRTHGTVHYGNDVGSHQYMGGSKALSGNAIFADEFHVFSIIWEENRIEWLLDGVTFYVVDPSDIVAGQNWPFNEPFFFIFNVAVGGNWPGSPDGSTQFPQRMIVDYVRVFQ